MILLGKPVAEKILTEAKAVAESAGVVPGLGVVLVGDDPASRVYVGIKETKAQELGFHFVKTELPLSATESEILDVIRKLNADENIHGIIVQLPLPQGVDADRVVAAIDPAKDADGFLATSVRIPVFPEAMIELAKSSGVSLSGKAGVVFVNSERFGRTMTDALNREGIVAGYILSSGLTAVEGNEKIQAADLVFTAIGRPETLSRNMFKKGAIVIDGGIAKKDGKVVGDVSREGSDEGLFLSPVPGGVGPVTVACLLRRVAILASEKEKTAT